jgi:cation diffusion facilitator CzcD-associated flavoprotein CzcO
MVHKSAEPADERYDVIVIGAGVGGIYAVHRISEQGLSVLGIESGSGVGGVWFHNRYPGARVDVDSPEYSYQFSSELASKWTWTERYAAQPELSAYLNFTADLLGVREKFRFKTRVTSAKWNSAAHQWQVSTDTGLHVSARFLVMASGNLSSSRLPQFPGLETFKGDCFLTSHWPQEDVNLSGRRVGVIGTGSSGVQVATALAATAQHLCVFQRTANYSVPAQNVPLDPGVQQQRAERLAEERAILLTRPAGTAVVRAEHPLSHYSESERLAQMERQWEKGGQGMTAVFSDQAVDLASNTVASDFVRNKIRQTVIDRNVGDALASQPYPIGTRRLILDTGYYEIFNQDNVTLVDLRDDPSIEITPAGIRTGGHDYDLDVIVFSLGFHASTGAFIDAGIQNEEGLTFDRAWANGPRTLLGLMSSDFPNLFFPTGAGSPSVLVNMILLNEIHADWIGDCISYMDDHGYSSIVPTKKSEAQWGSHVAELAAPQLRLKVDNYMVHVNADGSRIFMPYAGGLDRYVIRAEEMTSAGYEGFQFG